MVEKCVSRLWNRRQVASPETLVPCWNWSCCFYLLMNLHGPVSGYLPRISHGSPWPHEYPQIPFWLQNTMVHMSNCVKCGVPMRCWSWKRNHQLQNSGSKTQITLLLPTIYLDIFSQESLVAHILSIPIPSNHPLPSKALPGPGDHPNHATVQTLAPPLSGPGGIPSNSSTHATVKLCPPHKGITKDVSLKGFKIQCLLLIELMASSLVEACKNVIQWRLANFRCTAWSPYATKNLWAQWRM